MKKTRKRSAKSWYQVDYTHDDTITGFLVQQKERHCCCCTLQQEYTIVSQITIHTQHKEGRVRTNRRGQRRRAESTPKYLLNRTAQHAAVYITAVPLAAGLLIPGEHTPRGSHPEACQLSSKEPLHLCLSCFLGEDPRGHLAKATPVQTPPPADPQDRVYPPHHPSLKAAAAAAQQRSWLSALSQRVL